MNREKLFTNKINIIIIATICTFLWGSAFPAVKLGYEIFNISSSDTYSKFIFAGYRFFLAGIIVLIIKLLRKENIFDINKKDLKEISILGVIQTTFQYIFFYLGLTYTTGVRGSIINGTGTFFSILLAHFIYKNDKLSFNKVIGCVIGFLGVVLANTGALNGDSFTIKGEGFILIASLILSISSIYSKKISQNKDAYTVTGYQLLIGGFILSILGYLLGGSLTNFNIKSISLLIYMAFLSAIAFALWAQLLKYNKVSVVSVFNFLIPVFGTILSGIILKENIFNIKILISLILVCLGIFLVYRKKEYK